MDPSDPLRNPKDPLHGSGPQTGLELFRQLGKACAGLPANTVVDAACALLINAVRQGAPDWPRAEAAWDEIFGKAKSLLKGQYDMVNGRRRGIFPYDQVLQPEHFSDPDVVKKIGGRH